MFSRTRNCKNELKRLDELHKLKIIVRRVLLAQLAKIKEISAGSMGHMARNRLSLASDPKYQKFGGKKKKKRSNLHFPNEALYIFHYYFCPRESLLFLSIRLLMKQLI